MEYPLSSGIEAELHAADPLLDEPERAQADGLQVPPERQFLNDGYSGAARSKRGVSGEQQAAAHTIESQLAALSKPTELSFKSRRPVFSRLSPSCAQVSGPATSADFRTRRVSVRFAVRRSILVRS